MKGLDQDLLQTPLLSLSQKQTVEKKKALSNSRGLQQRSNSLTWQYKFSPIRFQVTNPNPAQVPCSRHSPIFLDARIISWGKSLFGLLRMRWLIWLMTVPSIITPRHHSPEAVAQPVEKNGLIVELTILVCLLPKAESQTRLGCKWLIWELIPKAQMRIQGRRRRMRKGEK